MTQEDKDLLLKDLCARLPYGVKGIVYAETTNGRYDIYGEMVYFDVPFDTILDRINITTKEIHVVAIGDEDTVDFIENEQNYGEPYQIYDFKPYLRPMSSMTDEEAKEYLGMLTDIDKSGLMNQNFITKVVDWLDEKMFDHRNLVPKGLALEAPEGMYKT